MTMKKLYRLLPALILILLLCSCAAVSIPIPDSMVFYDSGNIYMLDAKDFSGVCSLIGKRIPPEQCCAALLILEEDIKAIKETGALLEWSYEEPVDFLFWKGVTRMMMPLSGECDDMLFYGIDETYRGGPIALLYDKQPLYQHLIDIPE